MTPSPPNSPDRPSQRAALDLRVTRDTFPVRGTFRIARGSRTEVHVVAVTLSHGGTGLRGRGECVPYAHYGESLDSVCALIETVRDRVEAGTTRQQLVNLLPAGAARNALDAALWDLEIKTARAQSEPSPLPHAGELQPVRTMRTLSLGEPETMATEARAVSPHFDTLKLKLGGEPGVLDLERVQAVREAAPSHRLLVDANESWTPDVVEERIAQLCPFALSLVEQPVAMEHDAVLAEFEHSIPLCADESFHTAQDLDRVKHRYDMVNLKLDKTGGLTHALEARRLAQEAGLGVMVGCMLGTSLSMAPALVLAQGLDWVDLDGPYLLAEDRRPGLHLSDDGWMRSCSELWG